QTRDQSEMEILHPHYVVVGGLSGGERGEVAVDRFVVAPMQSVEVAVRGHEMHQRPQSPVAHSIVVVRDVALAQRTEHDLEAWRVALGWHHEPSGRLRVRARPGDPQDALMLEQAQEGCAYAAHGWLDSLLAGLAHDPYRRAIGHHDQPPGAQRMRSANRDDKLLGRMLFAFVLHRAALPARLRA